MAKQNKDKTNVDFVALTSHKTPSIKSIRGRAYVRFGDDNLYPQYLIDLYNRNATHNALISGKTTYIYGKGFKVKEESNEAVLKQFIEHPNNYESLNDIKHKTDGDLTLHGGFALQIIWGRASRKIAQICYIDIANLRVGEDENFVYYCEDWSKARPELHDSYSSFKVFDKYDRTGTSILIFKEPRAGIKEYQFPEYLGAIAAIESGIEVSNWHLNNIKNGFSSGTIISFLNGEPPEEMKREIKKKLINKTTGTDKAGNVLVNFSNGKDRSVEVLNLNPNDLDKQFLELNKHINQDIFVGHKITSPTLFGVATEGALGQRNEMLDAYEIFTTTYVEPKQEMVSRVYNELLELAGYPSDALEVEQFVPIKYQLSESTLAQVLSKDELRDLAGYEATTKVITENSSAVIDAINSLSPLVANKVLESMTANEIRGLVSLPAKVEGTGIGTPTTSTFSSDVLKIVDKQILLLLSKDSTLQEQDIANKMGLSIDEIRIILRKLNSSLMTIENTTNAGAIIRTLTDAAKVVINNIEDEQVEIFSQFGCNEDEYEIIENHFEFASDIENKALSLIKSNDKITITDLAKALDVDIKEAANVLQSLDKQGLVESKAVKQAGTTVIIRTVTSNGLDALNKSSVNEFQTMYKYALRKDAPDLVAGGKTRQFCKSLMGLKRLYSRNDIDAISARFGYNVFSMRGGYYHNPETDVTTPYCRHQWIQTVVKKK